MNLLLNLYFELRTIFQGREFGGGRFWMRGSEDRPERAGENRSFL